MGALLSVAAVWGPQLKRCSVECSSIPFDLKQQWPGPGHLETEPNGMPQCLGLDKRSQRHLSSFSHRLQVHTSAMQCHAVPCSAMQCHAVPCSAMQCHAVPCSAMQCHAVPCSAMQCHATCPGLLLSIVQFSRSVAPSGRRSAM